MRFLGPASRLLKSVRLQTKYYTPVTVRYREYVNLMPTRPIMADSLKSFIPQTRVLLESEVDEPAHKRLRLDEDKEVDNESEMEGPVASASQPTKNNGSEQRLKKKKNKKRREPPLPDLCSAADVLYQEIRLILGGDVVDRITSDGGAFKSPYSRGEEIEVTIDRMSAGGKFRTR